MAPTASPSERDRERVGPHPSYIEIAKPFILQSRIQKCLADLNMSDAKEDAVRLQGVAWIDQVRRTLQLPIRTFNTAVIYYHKFRLLHTDHEYNWADAAAAALFSACKIEDTLKKSREILCAHWNAKVAPGESLSSDDQRFESHSKLIIGLERLMLESAGFDFRNRYPQKLMVKLARALEFDVNSVAKTAWNLSIDLYRTFAPLKQTTPTMAIACLELAARLHEIDTAPVVDAGALRYSKWSITRAEVMETLLDLLDLYTHNRSSTSVGPLYTLEHFINIRIGLNQEASAAKIPRYALYASETNSDSQSSTNGLKVRNGIDSTSPLTPATPGTPGNFQLLKSAIGQRGQDGTVRFMLDAARARDERAEVDKFHKIEEEEYEVEVPNDALLDVREKDRARAGRDSMRSQDSKLEIRYENGHNAGRVPPIKNIDIEAEKSKQSFWNTYRKRKEVTSDNLSVKRHITEDDDSFSQARKPPDFHGIDEGLDSSYLSNNEHYEFSRVERPFGQNRRAISYTRGREGRQFPRGGTRSTSDFSRHPVSPGSQRDNSVEPFDDRKRFRSPSYSPRHSGQEILFHQERSSSPIRSRNEKSNFRGYRGYHQTQRYMLTHRPSPFSPSARHPADIVRLGSEEPRPDSQAWDYDIDNTSSRGERNELSADDGHQWAENRYGYARGRGRSRGGRFRGSQRGSRGTSYGRAYRSSYGGLSRAPNSFD